MRHHHHPLHDCEVPEHAMLRERLRHAGFGPGDFGGGPSGPGFGPHGFGRGGPHARRRKRGEIREAIIRLLADRPMHGYEMIQEIAKRSDGHWTPSPGSVYPMLQMLEDEGLITPDERDGRKVFSLTPAGDEHVAEHLGDSAPPWQPEEGEADSPHHRLRSAIGQVGMAVRQVAHAGDAAQVDATVAVLEQARRDIYGILAGDPPDA
jgi:DNA-binding PadR family transcriptional regulator